MKHKHTHTKHTNIVTNFSLTLTNKAYSSILVSQIVKEIELRFPKRKLHFHHIFPGLSKIPRKDFSVNHIVYVYC